MRSYFNLDGWDVEQLPELKAWREGQITRIVYDIVYIPEQEIGDETMAAHIEGDMVDVNGVVDYGSIIAEIIRSKYSADDTEAILANYNLAKDNNSDIDDVHRVEYIAEYNDYQQWRVRAKEIAKEVLKLL